MKENYKQLKQILDNAPEGSVFWDGEDYLDLEFRERVTNYIYTINKPVRESYTWVRKDPINTGKLRRLSDIQEIVDLMEKVTLAQVYTDKILEDLGDE